MRRSLAGVLSVRAAAAMFRRHTRGAARELAEAAQDPEAAQARVLARLSAAIARTEYGQQHGVDGALEPAVWAARVPIVTPAELAPWLAAERERPGALAPEPVRRWARWRLPDGSSVEVPSTATLASAFEHAFSAEAHELLERVQPRTGFAYAHIDPPDLREDTADEATYLGGARAAIVRRFLVVDPRVRELRSPAAFRLALAASLLAGEDLEVVSIWDPAELLALCDHILAHAGELAEVLAARRLTVEHLELSLQPLSAARRAALDAGDLRALWPELKLVSAWTTHTSAAPAAELVRRLPQALVHGKGLITTAGPLTIHLASADGYVPVLDQLYLELEGADGRVRPLHEAAAGETYEVIVSTPAGLARCRTGDRVRVTHHWGRVPCLTYAGPARGL